MGSDTTNFLFSIPHRRRITSRSKNKKARVHFCEDRAFSFLGPLFSPSRAKDGHKTSLVSALRLIRDANHFYIVSILFPPSMEDKVGYREQDDHKINLLSSFF